MSKRYFRLRATQHGSLQEKTRELLLEAIHSGTLPAEEPLPSCRQLSMQLGVSRNTVAIVYEGLVEDGYLISRPCSGYYLKETAPIDRTFDQPTAEVNWQRRFSHQPSHYTSAPRPGNWTSYPFPFIYGQRDSEHFPLSEWRVSARRLLDERQDKLWLNDSYDQDDPALIEQLRTRILPRRGIIADCDEILITLGSQNALFLIAQLLFTTKTQVSIENPGYRDAYNIFSRQGAQLDFCSVDESGITLSTSSQQSDYLYVTPSQQVPCGITMSQARRQSLLEQAMQHDQIIIEDDYDAELKIAQASLPALRSHPEGHRVIYLSSFSKTLSPGLRLGYVVADAELIDELRALRRLMYRHPPSSLQRQLAQFIAQGHFDRCLRHHQQDNVQRWDSLELARQHYLPDCLRISSEYANAFWLKAPEGCDTEQLRWHAAHKGVLIEPGAYHFFNEDRRHQPRQFMRLGFSAIKASRIEEGIRLLAEALHTKPFTHR